MNGFIINYFFGNVNETYQKTINRLLLLCFVLQKCSNALFVHKPYDALHVGVT